MCPYMGEVGMGDGKAHSDPETVDAVGKATEALEYVERARGHLYAFHQLIGRADFLFEEAARRLAACGHREDAASLWRSVVGRDVLEGRWTFEVVEHFDDDYYDAARAEVLHLETQLVGGRRHGHEEELRRRRRGAPALPRRSLNRCVTDGQQPAASTETLYVSG
jgi:hypothetical protein